MYYKKKQSKPRYTPKQYQDYSQQQYSHPHYYEPQKSYYSQQSTPHHNYYQEEGYDYYGEEQYDAGSYHSDYRQYQYQQQPKGNYGYKEKSFNKVKYQKKDDYYPSEQSYESYYDQPKQYYQAKDQEETKEVVKSQHRYQDYWEGAQEQMYDQERDYQNYEDYENYEGYENDYTGEYQDYQGYGEYQKQGQEKQAESASHYKPKETKTEAPKVEKPGQKFQRRPGFERPQFSANYGNRTKSVKMPSGKTTLLMVAEKPSIASAIAQALGGGKGRSSIHTLDYNFMGRPARIKVTSVTGHLYRREFPRKYADRKNTDPLDLYDAHTVRLAEKRSKGICKMLQNQSKFAHWLVLWLDCDREGENICYEVIDNVSQHLKDSSHILRARFSSIAPSDL